MFRSCVVPLSALLILGGALGCADPVVVPDAAGGPVISGPKDLPKPTAGGYLEGGMLATYWVADPATPDDMPTDLGTAVLQQLVPSLGVALADPQVAALYDEGELAVQLLGGIHIKEAGRYHLVGIAADSLQVRIGDISVLEFWDMGDETTGEAIMDLEAGWYPLEVRYVRDPYRLACQFWMAKDGALPELVTGELLGYDETPPEAPLTASVLSKTTWATGVAIRAAASHPAFLHLSSGDTAASSGPAAKAPLAVMTLGAGTTTPMSARVADIWGREVSLTVADVTTPTEPDYVPGGLLGTYYEDQSLESAVGQRVDAGIHLPDASGGGSGGTFGVAMPANSFSIRWDGAVLIEKTGVYTFWWGTDDGQRMRVGNEEMVEDWTNHGIEYLSQTVELYPGWWPIELEMYDASGASGAHLEWTGPGIVRGLIPGKNLGAELPSAVSGAPSFQGASFVQTGNKKAAVLWNSSELATGKVVLNWMSGDNPKTATHTFGSLADTFRVDFSGLVNGPVTATLSMVDRTGTPQELVLDLELTAP